MKICLMKAMYICFDKYFRKSDYTFDVKEYSIFNANRVQIWTEIYTLWTKQWFLPFKFKRGNAI